MHPVRYLFAVQLLMCTSKNTACGLTKLAAACTQTAERGKTSLLKSRSLLKQSFCAFSMR